MFILMLVVYMCVSGGCFFLQGTKCELKVKNGAVYEGVFKTYGPEVNYEHSATFFFSSAIHQQQQRQWLSFIGKMLSSLCRGSLG